MEDTAAATDNTASASESVVETVDGEVGQGGDQLPPLEKAKEQVEVEVEQVAAAAAAAAAAG